MRVTKEEFNAKMMTLDVIPNLRGKYPYDVDMYDRYRQVVGRIIRGPEGTEYHLEDDA